jgi:hypothetical protein
MAWSAAMVAFVAAIPLWRFTKYTITVAHEGGHAFFAVILGQAIKGVHVDRRGGGETRFASDIPWLADIIITLAGYLGPSLVGLGGTMLLLQGHPQWVLWLSLVLLAALLLKVRNPFAVIPVLATGAVIYWVARNAEPSAQLVFAYVWVWFLLIGGVRQISTLFWVTHEQQRGSDAAVMQRLTWLPDVFWLAVFWLGTLGALVWGGSLLLRYTA